jgi:cytochrome P450
MTREEIKATCRILIVAGSETTATLLSGATFLLLKNPSAMKKAVDEVRNNFVHASDITFASVTAQLPYLDACLEESLRLYPPVPSVLPRRTGPEGDIINGRFIPPDVSKVLIANDDADTPQILDFRRRPPLERSPVG